MARTPAPQAGRPQPAPLNRHDPRSTWLRVGLMVGLLVLIVGGGVAIQAWRTGRAPTATAPSAAPSVSFAAVTIESSQPIRLGSADATIRVTLYEDFRCPHCGEFEESYGAVIAQAQSAGRVVVELYPMAFIDQHSVRAANAMACAAEAGIGQPYYLGLFANIGLDWSNDQLIQLGQQIDPDLPDGFSTCVTAGEHEDWVSSINAAAAARGVTSTPTMFLDDQPVDLATLTPAALTAMLGR